MGTRSTSPGEPWKESGELKPPHCFTEATLSEDVAQMQHRGAKEARPHPTISPLIFLPKLFWLSAGLLDLPHVLYQPYRAVVGLVQLVDDEEEIGVKGRGGCVAPQQVGQVHEHCHHQQRVWEDLGGEDHPQVREIVLEYPQGRGILGGLRCRTTLLLQDPSPLTSW